MDLLESIGVFKTGDVKIRVASFICDEETCLFFGIFVFFYGVCDGKHHAESESIPL